MDATGAHLVVGTRNERAVDFYRIYGFHELEQPSGSPHAIVFGITMGTGGARKE